MGGTPCRGAYQYDMICLTTTSLVIYFTTNVMSFDRQCYLHININSVKYSTSTKFYYLLLNLTIFTDTEDALNFIYVLKYLYLQHSIKLWNC